MTAHSTRARRHGLGALGVAATLLVALASTASATTPPDSTTPADGSAAPADTAGGEPAADLEALYAAAQEEGQVNLIALPDTWANYGGILQSFRDKYPGVDNPVANPDASSADELTAVKTHAGQPDMPDVDRRRPAVRPAGHRRGHLGAVQAEHVGRDPRQPAGPRRQLGRRVLRDHGDRHQHDARRRGADDVRRPRTIRSTQGRSRSTVIPARPAPPSPL